MKALQVVEPGMVSILEVDQHRPQAGEATVKLHAAALNHRDQWIREGKYPNIVFNRTLGSDGCGEVVEVGSKQQQDWVGKTVLINPNVGWGDDPNCQSSKYEVLGMPTNGTLAEFITVPVHRLVEKPAHLTNIEGAALPLAGLTAYRAVFIKGQLQKGQHVLVTGIGGGVSQMVFLLAKAFEAEVSVTSGSNKKIERMIAEGAFVGYNYREDWARLAVADGACYDLIIDSAGGAQLNDLVKLAKPAGRIVFYGATTGLPPKLDLYRMFWNQITLYGSTMGNDQEFEAMVDLVHQKQLRPMIDSERPFEQVVDALDVMRNAQQMGKLVVTF